MISIQPNKANYNHIYAEVIEAERQNGRSFSRQYIPLHFFEKNVEIAIKISLKFVPKGPINNIQAFVQIMAWRRPGDKPLSEPMMVRLLMNICVTRPQWVNRIFCRPNVCSLTVVVKCFSKEKLYLLLTTACLPSIFPHFWRTLCPVRMTFCVSMPWLLTTHASPY